MGGAACLRARSVARQPASPQLAACSVRPASQLQKPSCPTSPQPALPSALRFTTHLHKELRQASEHVLTWRRAAAAAAGAAAAVLGALQPRRVAQHTLAEGLAEVERLQRQTASASLSGRRQGSRSWPCASGTRLRATAPPPCTHLQHAVAVAGVAKVLQPKVPLLVRQVLDDLVRPRAAGPHGAGTRLWQWRGRSALWHRRGHRRGLLTSLGVGRLSA